MGATPKTRRTRKAAPETVEVAPVVEEVEAPARPTKVNLLDLWEMRLAQQEKRAAEAEAEVARVSKLYVLLALDPKGRVLALEKKQDAAKHLAEKAETRALLAKKRIEGTLGRSMAGVAIDPETGEIAIQE